MSGCRSDKVVLLATFHKPSPSSLRTTIANRHTKDPAKGGLLDAGTVSGNPVAGTVALVWRLRELPRKT